MTSRRDVLLLGCKLGGDLPHYRVGGKVLVRRSEFDVWMARHRQVGRPDVDQIVRAALAGL